MYEIMSLKEGLELAIKHKACKGNREPFEKALSEYDTLECYQIALGSRNWLISKGIIESSDLPKLEELAQGIGKIYYDNGKLMLRVNLKNGKFHGLYEEWDYNGQLRYRINYKNGKRHGLCEELYKNGQICSRYNYKNGEKHGIREEWYNDGQLALRVNYKNGEIVS